MIATELVSKWGEIPSVNHIPDENVAQHKSEFIRRRVRQQVVPREAFSGT